YIINNAIMGYEDEEGYGYRGSGEGLKFIFIVGLNLAIIIVICRLLYVPAFPDDLKGTSALYAMPIAVAFASYLYLAFWFGWKHSLYIILGLGALLGMTLLTSVKTVASIQGLGIIVAIGYGIFLLIRSLIGVLRKKK